MRRAITLIGLVATLCLAVAQGAAADPVNATNASFFTAVFDPTAFDLTFSFTPTGGGVPEIDTETSVKAHQPSNAVTCELPAALNTVTFPEGTVVVSGTVTGFFTPARSVDKVRVWS